MPAWSDSSWAGGDGPCQSGQLERGPNRAIMKDMTTTAAATADREERPQISSVLLSAEPLLQAIINTLPAFIH